MELGGAWNPGSGTRLALPLRTAAEARHHLPSCARYFYWFQPVARLPTPAEWVTIRRTRVKEAVTTIWWLSKTDGAQADNRQVLKPYSKSMKRLLKDGYNPAMRPSQHEIGPHFQRDNGGDDYPRNILTVPNTRSYDDYLFRMPGRRPDDPSRALPAELARFLHPLLTKPGQQRRRPLRRQAT